jgi:hypothetical protein
MSDNLNLSDRKIIDTGIGGNALTDPDFRLPEVNIVGHGTDLTGGQDKPHVGTPTGTEVGVPTEIQLEKQTVRIQPDGSAVVDVILSYLPAQGATKHEMRISKR